MRTYATILCLLLFSGPSWAAEPTLARLSFWVPPERMGEFEAAYQVQIVPILKQYGFVESSERGRATVDSVFTRLFEFKAHTEITKKAKLLQKLPAWQKVWLQLGTAFGTTLSSGWIRYNFSLYTAPAGPGKVVLLGRGKGHWRTYDVADGLAGVEVGKILQDREGYLWFGTDRGISRYDGKSFTTFTTDDGLADDEVRAMLQDREGYLWFGTDRGISRYDGKAFTTFTTDDGLAHNNVWSILQDRKGHLWFGTYGGGVSRYDGNSFTNFTTQDGLVHNKVHSIFQDQEGYLWVGTQGGLSRYDGRTFTNYTAEDGLAYTVVSSICQDREGYLWFGTWGGGVSRYDGKTFTTFTKEDGLVSNRVRAIAQDREGYIWLGTLHGLSRYDGKTFANFTAEDGLAHNRVKTILQDREGHLWIGTSSGGVSRYDGKTFTTFTTEDGLAHTWVRSILQDREGNLWFGTWGGGVSRYDGKTFTTFTTEDGLAHTWVRSIFQDREGHLWFATDGGVSRYDGKTFTTFTTEDGLASAWVSSILQDQKGHLWFGTSRGVSRYDGKTFTTFTTEDGLAHTWVRSIFQDREGHLWFATGGGVSRYDGQIFQTLTRQDGLVHNGVNSIFQDREGHLWFATDGGVSQYDGKTFTTFTTKDGLAYRVVSSIFQDQKGHLWFATPGGVTRYDGRIFQKMLQRDGLGDNVIGQVIQDEDGNFWFATNKGVTRYRPSISSPPPVFIDAVVADRRYQEISEIRVPSSVELLAFEFHGISFKTRPEAMVYRYRLTGYDADWKTIREGRVEYQNVPRGQYRFEVAAVDRDLAYSDRPATVVLTVHLPYERIAWASALGIAVVLIVLQTVRVIHRDRRLREEAEAELQTAHDMQMALMPTSPPNVPGFDIAGRCATANHVGGDHFQYFESETRLSVTVADVAGKAMDAAIPVVMFSGILDTVMQERLGLDATFPRLNHALYRSLDTRTFICFEMAEIDPDTKTLRYTNGGLPYPYHFHDGDISELQVDAYPLGVRPDTEYDIVERQLSDGDYLVICSDGIAEAENVNGEQFGYERTSNAVFQACREGLSADGVIDDLLKSVDEFRGEAGQTDDMTCVVVKVLGRDDSGA